MVDKTFLLVTRDFWPGVVNCLENMAVILKELHPNSRVEVSFIGKHGVGIDVLKRLKQEPPNYLIVGGWDNAIKMLINNAPRKTKVILKWCSPITQVELGEEMPQFAEVWQLSYTDKINHIALGLESDTSVLNQINEKVCLLPVYLDTKGLDKINANEKIRREGINCDIFCAANPRKNILAQLFSLSTFKDLKVHVNFGHNSTQIYPAIASFAIENLINHGWLGDRNSYLSTIKAMDFAMAATLCESLNYTAAEHMYYGIPVICSKAAPFMKDAKAIDPISIERPENIKDIQKSISFLMESESNRKEMGEACREIFLTYNGKVRDILKENLEAITS